jgi:sugar-specific transcriptional regulator TrmB
MDLINSLKKIGFTQQEAIIYIHLCKNNEITGYEAAKLSGISRSNAYASLSSLVDKGYANMVESSPSKYVAVPKEELIKNAEREFKTNINVIHTKLEYNQPAQEPYVTITGEEHIINKLKNIIDSAEKRIYISCNHLVLDSLYEELYNAVNRGLKVVILSSEDPSIPQHIYYYLETYDSIKIITDTLNVLAGTLKQSLYSRNTTLVTIIREAFINEIAVINMQNDN